MSEPTPTPEDKRILAMVFEAAAEMHDLGNRPQTAKDCRHYAKRFQPKLEPEPRFIADKLSIFDTLTGCGYGWATNGVNPQVLDLMNELASDLHNAAKGGKGT